MASRKIQVVVAGDASSLDRALKSAGNSAAVFGKRMGTLGRLGNALKFAAATAGVAGIAAAFVKTAQVTVGFDKAMRNVNSIAQLSEGQLKGLEKQVLALAGKTAQAPQALAEGLYDLVSSGFDANDSMTILKATAKAATAGLTDTATSTKAVAAVLNAYHLKASAAADVSDTLFQTVNRGVINFETLSSVIGDVLPFASSLGVGLHQVGAALSTMTKEGLSGEEATTRLKNVMVTMLKPGDALSAAFKKLGVGSGEALIKQKGFQRALEAVIGTTDGSKKAIAALFPNIRSLGGALALTGKNARTAHTDLAAFRDVTGATDKALSQQSKSIAFQWNKIKAIISSLAIQLGSKLIPAASAAIQAFGKFVGKLETGGGKFAKFRDQMRGAAREVQADFKALVAVLGPVITKLATEFQKLPTAMKEWIGLATGLGLIGAAFGPVGIAIAAVAAGAIFIKRNWATVGPIFQAVKGVVLSAVGGIVTAVQAVVNAVRSAVQWVRTAVSNIRAELSSWKVLWAAVGIAVKVAMLNAKVALAVLGPAVRAAMAIAKAAFTAGWSVIKATTREAVAVVGGIVRGMANVLKGAVQVITGVFRGDFGRMWAGVKTIFSGGVQVVGATLRLMTAPARIVASTIGDVLGAAWHGLLGVVKAVIGGILGAIQLFLGGIAKMVGAVAKLPIIGGKFKGLASQVQGAADKVGALRAQIDGLHDKTITITTKINGPSGKVSGGKGHKVAQGASADGPGGGPYFETEASIANAQAYQEALQAKFQAADDARQQKSLANALARAVKAKKGVTDAKRAVQDFARQMAQTRALSTIDVKVKGLQAVKAFKDSLTAVRGQLKDLAQQAADVWRGKAEAAIAGGPLAQQLAGLQAQDAAADDAATRAQNAQDLADAVASGDVAAQKKANDAIAAYDRQVQEKTIQDQIDAQIAGLDVQEANYKTTLDNQLGALADNLQNGKIMYATFASDVNAILAQYGLNYNASPDEEAAINAHPAGAPKAKAKKPKKKRAMGGPVAKGTAYWVGERGPETFVPNQSGQIIPAGGGGGGNVIMTGTVHIGSKLSARILANKLAHQLAH